MTDLAIVIVSYNTRQNLESCLHSLCASSPQVNHQIVVVDNGSSDGSVEAVRAGWPNVRLIQSSSNVGYARANNIGIRTTTSNLVLLLNSDTIVPPGAVDGLVKQLRAHPDVAVVGPRLVDADGHLELSYGRMIGPLNELWQKLRSGTLKRNIPLLASSIVREATKPAFPHWVSGACLLVNRSDAEAAGLLDERFFLYGEDVDFCSTIRRSGRRVLFTPEVEVVHLRGQSWTHAPAATQTSYRQSQLAFYKKHHPAWVSALRLYLWLRGQLPVI